MNISDTPKFEKFRQVSEQINGLIRTANVAREIPGRLERAAQDVRVMDRSYGNATSETMKAASLHLAMFAGAERIRGEAMCREKLAAISSEIESLRVQLPALAAAACVELGALARALKDEANG